MSDEDLPRRRLADFFETFVGQAMPDEKLDALLAKGPTENDLLARLCEKYKIEPKQATTRRKNFNRVDEFYAKYAPKNRAKTGAIMKKYTDFAELMSALRAKHSISEEDFPNAKKKGEKDKANKGKTDESKKEDKEKEEVNKKKGESAELEAAPAPAAAVPESSPPTSYALEKVPDNVPVPSPAVPQAVSPAPLPPTPQAVESQLLPQPLVPFSGAQPGLVPGYQDPHNPAFMTPHGYRQGGIVPDLADHFSRGQSGLNDAEAAMAASKLEGLSMDRTLKLRAQAMAEREAALRALDAAVQQKMDALAALSGYGSDSASIEKWRRPAEPTLESNKHYIRHLNTIEATLMEKACALKTLEVSLTSRQAAIEEAERELEDERAAFVRMYEEFTSVRSRDIARRSADNARLEEQRKQLETRLPEVETRERRAAELIERIEARETAAAGQERDVAARERALVAQLKTADAERDLAKQLSEEVLKREVTVRNVEKALNQARLELTRLEDELGARTKRLVADEASLRTWAGDLERRETKLQLIIDQLRQKGISITGL